MKNYLIENALLKTNSVVKYRRKRKYEVFTYG